jgi:hypothetical protein
LQRGGLLYGANAEQLSVCQDLNDYWALGGDHVGVDPQNATLHPTRVLLPSADSIGYEEEGFYGMAQCGYGTHTEQCGERVVYVHADAPGGCEQTCNIPEMLAAIDPQWQIHNQFDYNTFCSDGGENSRRVLFRMPSQRDPRENTSDFVYKHVQEISGEQYRYYDFACSYGTQVSCTLHITHCILPVGTLH